MLPVHAGVLWKSPPVVDPFFTSTLPPISRPEISFALSAGFGSISSAISLRRWNVPWLWPISTTPRPLLWLAR